MSQWDRWPGATDPFAPNPFGPDSFAGPHPPVWSNPPPAHPSGKSTNTLATLSLVFAFVFAPVGVVLGHLGLAEIRRSGQRGRDRALVGLTTSYAVILIAIAALVVSMVMRKDSATPAMAAAPSSVVPPSSASAIPMSPSTTRPSSAPLAAPRVQQGPTIQPAGLTALLLTAYQISADIGVAGMHVAHSDSEPIGYEQITPERCGPIYHESGGPEYRDSGFTGASRQSVIDPAWPYNYIVGQAAFAFPTAESAQAFLTKEAASWSSCVNTDASRLDSGKADHFTHTGQPRSDGVTLSVTNDVTDPVDKCQRSLTGRGNVVIDVSLCGPKVDAETTTMALEIARKIGS